MSKPKMEDRLFQRADRMSAAERNLEPLWIVNAWITTGDFGARPFTLNEFHGAYSSYPGKTEGSSISTSKSALVNLVSGGYLREIY